MDGWRLLLLLLLSSQLPRAAAAAGAAARLHVPTTCRYYSRYYSTVVLHVPPVQVHVPRYRLAST